MPVKTTAKKPIRRRVPKAAEPEVVETVAAVAEPEKAQDTDINRVYLGTHAGVKVYEGPQAEPLIREIREAAGEDDSPFICYEDGMPVYVALRASALRPITYPEPGTKADQYGLTSVELYGLAVTFPSTIARIVEKETQGKQSLLTDAKKIMTLALPIVAAILAIFIMAVLLRG
jgi:hypothetical protein